MPNTATVTEMIAIGTSKSACTSVGNATLGSTHSLNFSIPKGAALRSPANTEKIERMMSGTVMSGSDSCGWPWPAVLAEEREVDATGHVGRGEERADEADHEEGV